MAELDSRLAAKRHRLAALQDLDQPPAEQIASLRKEIALLRTQLDVAQQKDAPSRNQARTATVALSLPKLQASLGSEDVMRHLAAGRNAQLDLVHYSEIRHGVFARARQGH